MYTITIDNRPLYDPRREEYPLKSPKLSRKANKAGSLSFIVPPTHREIGNFVKLKTVCRVYKGGGQYPIWCGRVFYTRLNMDGSLYVECEGLLSYLLDTNMRVYDYSGTLAGFLELIIDTHNQQAADAQKIVLGTVTVTDDNDYIHRSSTQYITCWEAIEKGLIKTHGGYVRLRYTAAGTVLDWLAGGENDLNTSTQTIEYGENLTAITQEISAEETFTVCIPHGAKQTIEVGYGETAEQPLTVESVNNGLDYVVNEDAFALYGWICAPVSLTTWEDVTQASNLLRKATEFLNNTGVKLKNTITLTAVDLHNKNADIQAFEWLDRVRVQSTPHNISGIYVLSEMDTPLDNPQGATITLGDTHLTLVDAHIQAGADAQERIDAVVGVVGDNAASEEAHYSEMVEATLALQSLIERTSEELTSIMTREYVRTSTFEEYKQTVTAEFKQTAEDFLFSFKEITSQISTISGETNSKFSEIEKYIRFVDGNIVLGETGNMLTLRISNDRISFLLDNTEIAYFSSNRMYVNNLEAITTLTCGNFAFLPRDNGNLSLRMIAGQSTLARTIWNTTRTAYVWNDIATPTSGFITADDYTLITADGENFVVTDDSGATDSPTLDVAFVANDDGSVTMQNAAFTLLDDGSVQIDNATFTVQDDGSVLVT